MYKSLILATGRQTGKTTRLIKACGKDFEKGINSVIVTFNMASSICIEQEGLRMGIRMNRPITYESLVQGANLGRKYDKMYFDEVGIFLERLARAEVAMVAFNGDLWKVETKPKKRKMDLSRFKTFLVRRR